MKFSIKHFFRKCDQILRKLRSAVLVPSNIPKGIEMELIWLGRGLDSYFWPFQESKNSHFQENLAFVFAVFTINISKGFTKNNLRFQVKLYTENSYFMVNISFFD